MTLHEQIAALPKMPEITRTSFDALRPCDVIAFAQYCEQLDAVKSARLALTRRALQAIVEIVEAGPRTQVVADTCADARRVLEATK